MDERRFKDGETLWRAGEPADCAYRIRIGAVRLETAAGALRLGAGEIAGGFDLIRGDGHDATAVAEGDVVALAVHRPEFMALLARAPELTEPFVDRVLRSIEHARRVAPEPDAAAPAEPAAAVPPLVRLVPRSKRMGEQIGEGVAIESFPYRIGRRASREDGDEYADVSLHLRDAKPYNLSRRHFEIALEDGAIVVRDLDSYHGTRVNGRLIGAGTGIRSTRLHAGENEITAGHSDSPVRLAIVVERRV